MFYYTVFLLHNSYSIKKIIFHDNLNEWAVKNIFYIIFQLYFYINYIIKIGLIIKYCYSIKDEFKLMNEQWQIF